MANVYEEALELHEKAKGKLGVSLRVDVETKKDLSLAYTPGVAEPCRKIHQNKNKKNEHCSFYLIKSGLT